MAKLYLIPTPVGNLEDISLRALRILKEVPLVLAEDTRTSAKLLKHYEINTPLLSHHKFNEHQQVSRIAERIARGEDIALISDAGTPGISDPGFLLVRLPCDRFCFEGFLPQKKGRQKKLIALAEEERTMIFYESPFRLVKALEQMAEFFGENRHACVAREISKLFEDFQRGTLKELIDHFTENGVKGEIVIIVEGKPKKEEEESE